MIQDIYPHQLFNQYDPAAVIAPGDPVLAIRGAELLVRCEPDGTRSFPTAADFPDGRYTYLFRLDDRRFFLREMPECFGDDLEKVTVFQLRQNARMPKPEVFAALTGKHLADWYRDSRFCGRCGQPMTHSAKERAMCCKCGNTVYPRIMPAVIVAVKNGDSLLLTKYRTGYGHYALIAGFTEIGETAEETVAREVMEEAGIRVKNIRYYKTQPWGVANDLLLGYYCEVDGDTEIHMDANELRFAQWVRREEIQLQPDDYSLTNEMMMRFQNREEI